MDTLQAGCIPLWDRNSLKLFSAISQNNPSKQVIDFNLIKMTKIFNCMYFYGLVLGFQKWIGYVDVKTAPVYFYVNRNSHLPTANVSITYESARVNVGGGMNAATGKFTAPRTGIYFFSFSAVAAFPASSTLLEFSVGLYLNGTLIGASYVEDANIDSVNHHDCPFSLQSTVSLNKGDQIWLQIRLLSSRVYLANHYTYFTGWLIEEDLSQSLL